MVLWFQPGWGTGEGTLLTSCLTPRVHSTKGCQTQQLVGHSQSELSRILRGERGLGLVSSKPADVVTVICLGQGQSLRETKEPETAQPKGKSKRKAVMAATVIWRGPTDPSRKFGEMMLPWTTPACCPVWLRMSWTVHNSPGASAGALEICGQVVERRVDARKDIDLGNGERQSRYRF